MPKILCYLSVLLSVAVLGWPQSVPSITFRPGSVSVVAGSGTSDYSGDNGPALEAAFREPTGVALAGNHLYIADSDNNVVRQVDLASGDIYTLAGTGEQNYSGDGGPAASAALNTPNGVAADSNGNVYIADTGNNVIRKVDARGVISTVVGNAYGTISPQSTDAVGDGGLATTSLLWNPAAIALDSSGNIYIADTYNNRIRKVDATTQIITTVAGSGVPGYSGDGFNAQLAEINMPTCIAVDASGDLALADAASVIRWIDHNTQVITTIAGAGTTVGNDQLGDGGAATVATLSSPMGLAFDPTGRRLFISDSMDSLIREIDLATGNITVSAGIDPSRWQLIGSAGPISPTDSPLDTDLNVPVGIALDKTGNVYFADSEDQVIRRLSFGSAAIVIYGGSGSLQLFNDGTQALSLTSTFIGSASNAFISQIQTCSPIPAGSTCILPISLQSQDIGWLSATMTLTDSAGESYLVSITGQTGFSAGSILVEPNVSSLDFSTIQVGESTGETVTITNFSDTIIGQLSVSITGSNVGDFVISATTCEGSLGPNASCTISVTFTPTAAGSRNAALTLVGINSTINTQMSQSVSLSGVAIARISPPVVSPAVLSFANTGASTLPMAQTATLLNASAVALEIASISTSRPDIFSISSNCPTSLPALSSCTVSVGFTPTASTVSPAALTITFASGAAESVTLTTSNPVVTLTGPAGSLGPQTRNLRSAPVAYALQNLGSAAMAVSAISIGGTNASDFQQVNNCGTSVAAGQGCTIWLTYLPTGNSPASSSATIVVTDSAPGSPYSIAVAGTATGASQALIDFDTPRAGATVSGTIPLSGWAISDNGPLTVLILAVDGVSVGSANYGGSRPDVCAVFPGRASCPNVGWSSSLDTTKLADGAHTLTLTASMSSGKTTAALPFTVANWARGTNKTTIIDIDSPNAAAILSGTSVFSGWVVDNASSISSVSLSVDGVPLTAAHYGSARPDVCAVFPGRSGCPNVGWNASVDTRQFSNGQHTLAVTARTGNGTTATVATSFRVGNATPSGLITCIDSPAGTAARGILAASGWAIDTTTAIAAVTLSVDGVPQGTASAVARPDVCAAYGSQPGCPNVGWAGRIDTTTFADGAHTLGLLVQTADGHELAVSKPFTVANAAPAGKTTLVNIDAPSPSAGPLSGVVHFAGWAIDQATAIATVEIAIDGVPVSFLQLSVSRPDVCAAFPAAVGCPTLGWTTSFDSSSLPDGTHLLQVIATSQQGMRATRTVPFVTSNAAAAAAKGQYIVMDYPQPGAVISGAVSLSGWAVNRTGNVQQVVITVDGVTAGTAIYGNSRPDVCAVLESTSCPNVGWAYVLNTTWLSNGVHTLRATEFADNGCTTVSRSIVVSNAPTSLLIDVDTAVVNHTFSNTIGLSGWVIDNQNAVSAVTVAVDGLPIGNANYGSSRPDVCAVFPGRAGCPNVGWSFSLDTTAFLNGPHTLQISAISTANVRSTVSLPFNSSN